MSEPIIRDWTNKTLVIDLTNSLGETYHFEIEPNEDSSKMITRASDGPDKDNGIIVELWMPIGVAPDKCFHGYAYGECDNERCINYPKNA